MIAKLLIAHSCGPLDFKQRHPLAVLFYLSVMVRASHSFDPVRLTVDAREAEQGRPDLPAEALGYLGQRTADETRSIDGSEF